MSNKDKDFFSTKGDAYKTVHKELESWPKWKRDAYNENFANGNNYSTKL